jgi:hypothetical protein
VVAHEERGGPCLANNEETLRALIAESPDLVVTTGRADKAFVDSGTGEIPGVLGFVDLWSRLNDAGVPVSVIRPTPHIDSVLECVTTHMDNPNECAVPAADEWGTIEQQIFARAIELAPFVQDVDLREHLCDSERCFAAIGNVIVYRDVSHITADFSRSLATPLRTLLQPALPATP